MSSNPYARGFRELIVYQKVRSVAKQVFDISKSFPKEEQYSLTDQVRRSSRSIGGQIAEAWAKRRYQNHFIAKLSDADGEQAETQHWLDTSLQCSYVTEKEHAPLLRQCMEIGPMLGKMMKEPHKWTGRYDEPR